MFIHVNDLTYIEMEFDHSKPCNCIVRKKQSEIPENFVEVSFVSFAL